MFIVNLFFLCLKMVMECIVRLWKEDCDQLVKIVFDKY